MRAYRKRRVFIVYDFKKRNGDFGTGNETYSFKGTHKLTQVNIDDIKVDLCKITGAKSVVITNIVYL